MRLSVRSLIGPSNASRLDRDGMQSDPFQENDRLQARSLCWNQTKELIVSCERVMRYGGDLKRLLDFTARKFLEMHIYETTLTFTRLPLERRGKGQFDELGE